MFLTIFLFLSVKCGKMTVYGGPRPSPTGRGLTVVIFFKDILYYFTTL